MDEITMVWIVMGFVILLTLLSLPAISRSNPLSLDGIPSFLKKKSGEDRFSTQSKLKPDQLMRYLNGISGQPITSAEPARISCFVVETKDRFFKVGISRKGTQAGYAGRDVLWYLLGLVSDKADGSEIQAYYQASRTNSGLRGIICVGIFGVALLVGMTIWGMQYEAAKAQWSLVGTFLVAVAGMAFVFWFPYKQNPSDREILKSLFEGKL